MEREHGPRRPDRFPSEPGIVFPMYHVFADVGEYAGGLRLAAESTDPLAVAALALSEGDHLRVLVGESPSRGAPGSGRGPGRGGSGTRPR